MNDLPILKHSSWLRFMKQRLITSKRILVAIKVILLKVSIFIFYKVRN